MNTKDLKARRVDAGITRAQVAKASGISQYKIDRLERGDAVDAEDQKKYADAMTQLIKTAPVRVKAEAKPAKVVATKKAAAPVKKAATKPRNRTARKSAQAKAEPRAEADDPQAEAA
jgi:transcriptional regulator with XRE-family HTH domain